MKNPVFTSKISQYLIVILIIALTVLFCRPLADQQGYHIVSFILLFVVSIMAAFMRIGPILLASTISSLVWNYFFIPPHSPFHIAKTEDRLMFGSFFFVALLNGVLTNRIRRQEKLAREREERTSDTLLSYQTTDFNKTELFNEIFKASARFIITIPTEITEMKQLKLEL